MNLTDDEILELHTLCSNAVDRRLDRTAGARLNTLLAQSEDARQLYVRWMALSASLHDYAGELQTDEPMVSRKIVSVAAWRWTIGTLAAAAAVVAAFWIAGASARRSADPFATASEDELFVATLSATNGCRWEGSTPALGEELRQGSQLQLVSGLAEVTFNSGAQVVLEGPAALNLASAWEAVLHRGSLRAQVPPEAIGFRVSNADVKVTDLGTEFSMVAGEKGGTEVFVLEGAVEASAEGTAQPIMLREQQARRFDRSSITEVRDREQKLKRWAGKSKLVQFTRAASYVHWSFDQEEGAAFIPEFIGSARPAKISAKLIAANGVSSVSGAGRRERALVLDGQSGASGQVSSTAKSSRTIAFWVQVPEDATLTEAGPMIALEDRTPAAISWNRDPTQGALGALRTETEQGRLVGSAVLRDGKWHHVAVVIVHGGRARQYVDGRLDAAAAKQTRRHDRREHGPAASATLTIGRASTAEDFGDHFRGAIDELFLADRALTPIEIRQLQRENQPAPRVTIAESAGR